VIALDPVTGKLKWHYQFTPHDEWATAFDPSSSLYYIQAIESCGVYSKGETDWTAGKGFMGGSSKNASGMQPQRLLRAIDINTGKIAWEMPEVGSGESRSGVLATAGGLIFLGEDSGAFVTTDSSNGKVLWHLQTSQSIRSSPMTYVFDNKQYVSIASGSNIIVFGLME
jgi:alcohol dehydrogenase (cytochrome c)